jgi:hypothetical protein
MWCCSWSHALRWWISIPPFIIILWEILVMYFRVCGFLINVCSLERPCVLKFTWRLVVWDLVLLEILSELVLIRPCSIISTSTSHAYICWASTPSKTHFSTFVISFSLIVLVLVPSPHLPTITSLLLIVPLLIVVLTYWLSLHLRVILLLIQIVLSPRFRRYCLWGLYKISILSHDAILLVLLNPTLLLTSHKIFIIRWNYFWIRKFSFVRTYFRFSFFILWMLAKFIKIRNFIV